MSVIRLQVSSSQQIHLLGYHNYFTARHNSHPLTACTWLRVTFTSCKQRFKQCT
jgi:hypothetical protein